ncbi:hypothetical protein [Polyangium jinanense]|uniref:Uncharacterized protein n=1 Tax=Polyangium jinanense TaxID=2829994 RepID=A0A9X3WW36_9BACT|nr:hypothetical protein [Polyangium jinanense]MDC3953692.1 hypothetical protein [Polyangium jinanense]MDC3979187.1 hypothetical protein [Polyangium jinanense]
MKRNWQRTFVVAAASLALVVASSVAGAEGAPSQPQPGSAPPDPRYPAPYPYPYPYPPPPYGYRLPSVDPQPEIIEYEEGKPIPLGYTRVHRNRRKLVIAGTVLLATAYGISLMGATTSVLSGDERFAMMYIPVAGPFLTIGAAKRDLPSGLKTVFLLDGLTQVVGTALLVTGIAWKEDFLQRDDTIKPKEALVPELLIGPGSAGVRLRF